MAEPQEVWRAMTSGSRSRFTLGTVAKHAILPTIDILGPNRSMRNMHQFVVKVCFRDDFAREDTSKIARYDLQQRKDIIEIRESHSADSLYPGTKFFVNPDHAQAIELAKAVNIQLVGREIRRDLLAEMVELQVAGDIAHRKVELMARGVTPPDAY